MAGSLSLTEAVALSRTGDLWLFRGSSAADRTIQTLTNSPVNHVGVVIAMDDLPPLLWHAELGRALPDLWTGRHQRGAQLHDLVGAVTQWTDSYHQRAWLRQLDPVATEEMEDAALRVVARLDGTPFPSTTALTARWFSGRVRRAPRPQPLETAYCAEVVAVTLREMGLLPSDRPPNWYDPGRFWSGDELPLLTGRFGAVVPVDVPAPDRWNG
jgi:hypothetical protein